VQAGDDACTVELRLKSLRNPARKIEHTALGEGVSHLLVYHRVYPSKRERQKTLICQRFNDRAVALPWGERDSVSVL